MGIYIKPADLSITPEMKVFLTRGAGTTVDKTKIERAIDYAEGRINMKLGVTKDLPLTATGITEGLKSVADDLTIYRLYLKHSGARIPEKITDAKTDAMDLLNDIVKKLATLGEDTDDAADNNKNQTTPTMRG